jgi:hypothetical protein
MVYATIVLQMLEAYVMHRIVHKTLIVLHIHAMGFVIRVLKIQALIVEAKLALLLLIVSLQLVFLEYVLLATIRMLGNIALTKIAHKMVIACKILALIQNVLLAIQKLQIFALD